MDELLKERSPSNQTKQIAAQIRLLQQRHGCRRKDLMSFSTNGDKHPHATIRNLYSGVVSRIENHSITLGEVRTIEEIVSRDRHIFRRGTHTSSSERVLNERKQYYQNLVQEVSRHVIMLYVMITCV